MKNLNQFWTILVAAGFLLLVVSGLWNLSQSLSGADNNFKEKVTPFESNILMPQFVEDHIVEKDIIIDSNL
ncbi:hypothetical protein KC678_05365 [Candidatus Dojkabacteria bacterium]|uniref:Uncharacterized protein n=1 Tax=Candidatus Dojkabacteria bacterium TaxID=2099670 RepID=A0A955L2G2_9BACT|nr:hypothetical protein [Candidatus Dojkabacteria bacterium]